MADHREHGGQGRELTAQEEFESIRLLAEALSSPPPAPRPPTPKIVPVQAQPTAGDAVPFAQPGRPAMSQQATDHATLVIVYSFGSLPIGGAISLVLWRLSSVSSTTLAIAGTCAAGVFIAVGSAARMVGRAIRDSASALPDNTVNQYTGTVYVQHTELHTETRGFGRTNNQLTDGQQ